MSTHDHASDERLGEALSDVTQGTRDLIRAEIDSARRETVARARANAPGIAMIAAAAGCAAMAAGSSYVLSLRLLERAFGRRWAAACAVVTYGGLGAGLGVAGVRWLRNAPSPLPIRTLRDAGDAVSRRAPSR